MTQVVKISGRRKLWPENNPRPTKIAVLRISNMKKKFTAGVVIVAVITFLMVFTIVSLNIAGIKGFSAPKQQQVTGAKGWAIGYAAMLMEKNHSRHDILAADEINFRTVLLTKIILSHFWGVRNQTELLKTLAWLDEQGGHRKLFDIIGKDVSNMGEEQFQSVLAMYGADMEKKQKLIIARQYYKQLGKKSILGWDYTRCIALCRWGYTVGYITEQQAWDKIMPIARKLQKTFDSWEDLGENYLIGRQFWSYSDTQDTGDLFVAAFNRLKQKKTAPETGILGI
jgi:hypothetical protein